MVPAILLFAGGTGELRGIGIKRGLRVGVSPRGVGYPELVAVRSGSDRGLSMLFLIRSGVQVFAERLIRHWGSQGVDFIFGVLLGSLELTRRVMTRGALICSFGWG